MNFDEFVTAYLACALWSSTDEDGIPLDSEFDIADLSDTFLSSAGDDCREFIKNNAALLEIASNVYGYTTSSAGHDFWLTRNGHGAGFWDRGLGEVGTKLTAAANGFGSLDLYVGDDNRIYGG